MQGKLEIALAYNCSNQVPSSTMKYRKLGCIGDTGGRNTGGGRHVGADQGTRNDYWHGKLREQAMMYMGKEKTEICAVRLWEKCSGVGDEGLSSTLSCGH